MNKIITLVVAMLLLFIMASTIFMGFFSTTYEHGFGDDPCNKDDTCTLSSTNTDNSNCLTASETDIACTNCNTSSGYEFFLNNCYSLLANTTNLNGSYCRGCTTFQGYRTSVSGLMLLVFVLAIIGFAISFIPRFRI